MLIKIDMSLFIIGAAADFTILPSAAGHAKSKNANAADLSCESKVFSFSLWPEMFLGSC